MSQHRLYQQYTFQVCVAGLSALDAFEFLESSDLDYVSKNLVPSGAECDFIEELRDRPRCASESLEEKHRQLLMQLNDEPSHLRGIGFYLFEVAFLESVTDQSHLYGEPALFRTSSGDYENTLLAVKGPYDSPKQDPRIVQIPHPKALAAIEALKSQVNLETSWGQVDMPSTSSTPAATPRPRF